MVNPVPGESYYLINHEGFKKMTFDDSTIGLASENVIFYHFKDDEGNLHYASAGDLGLGDHRYDDRPELLLPLSADPAPALEAYKLWRKGQLDGLRSLNADYDGD